jgi:glycosyltransferase involved in cell wall biosynthesis
LYGLANARPEQHFSWYYRSHRLRPSWGEALPLNVRRRLLLDRIGFRGGLFHGLNQRLPKRRFRYQIATFHDLFVITGNYSTPEFRKRFTEQARHAAAEADMVIAVSRFTANQVQDLLEVEPDRIRVVHHGVRPLPALAAPQPRQNIVLNVGAIQERKNIGRLVDAFQALPKDWRLVLAGSAGYGAEQLTQKINAHPRITVTGYVTPEELAKWYATASIFAFPSLDEGFGMPVLEAMAAGVPVVTSNRSALPEVAGMAALLVDPYNTQEIAEALQKLASSSEERRRWSIKGKNWAENFTWHRAVSETWQIYQEVIARLPRQSSKLSGSVDPEK